MADPFLTSPSANGSPWIDAPTSSPLSLRDLMLERGTSGLRRMGGYVQEEFLPELQGQQGLRVYREMKDNSAVVGSSLFAYEMLIRKVPWLIKPAEEESVLAEQYAEFVRGVLFDDMDMPWSMVISEVLSMLWAGFSYHEMVFKRRLGEVPPAWGGQPQLSSHFDDGAIGLAKIAPRAQDTVLRWAFDDQTGALAGMHQMDTWSGRQAWLPYEKCLLFRPTSWKDSPEGRSVLRTAYRPWYMLKHLENIEGIGAERDLSGLPVFYTPPHWWGPDATAADLAQLDMVKSLGRSVRKDEQSCLVLPTLYDLDGHKLLEFQLAASAGTRAFNTNEIIQRYELRIAQSMLADLVFLGHEAVGSFALASSKTNILSMALSGYLMAIADVFNRRCLPLLWRLNAYPKELMPTLTHGDVESVDLTELGTFIKDMALASFDPRDLENHVRMLAGMPERDEEVLAALKAEDAAAQQIMQANQAKQADEEEAPVEKRWIRRPPARRKRTMVWG